MTLEGSLDAFSLPDIFQLLSFTKKTGALHIAGPGAPGVVHFAAGSVTGASSDARCYALGRRLVGAGLADDETLAAAVARVREEEATGIGTALHAAGAIDDGVLHEHVVEQTVDAVFDLLRWSHGDFRFVGDEPNPDDLGVSLPVEEVVAEGRRRLETWEGLTKVVPSPDAVVGVAVRGVPETTTLTADEWALLALVDSRRTVADLVRVTGRGEFATVRTLAALVERGLAVVRAAGDEGRDQIAALLRRQSELSVLEGRPEPALAPEREPAAAPPAPSAPAPDPAPRERLASVPPVVPQRPEPLVARQPDFPEPPVTRPAPRSESSVAEAVEAVDTVPARIEHDPSVNKSLLLRLIAGVRGL